MEIIANSIQTLKPMNRFHTFITDRVVIALMLAFLVLLALDPSQAFQSLRFSLQSMLQIAPFFILAIVFAGYAKATGIDAYIAKAFSGNIWMTIVLASLAGALSPFCSCGVIPLIAAMLVSGVPLAPFMAFCISSPIMDPEMFIMTASAISLNFAVAKTIAAFGMGLGAGFAIAGLQKVGLLHHPLKRSQASNCCQSSFDASSAVTIFWKFWQKKEGRVRFTAEISENGLFLGKWMFIAFLMESLMIAYILTGVNYGSRCIFHQSFRKEY